MIAAATILSYIASALSAVKVIVDLGGDAVDLAVKAKPIYDKAANLLSKMSKGEEITQEELDAIEADSDRLNAIAEAHEAQTPPADESSGT